MAGACRDEFNVQVHPEIRLDVIEGKTLITVFVPEASIRQKPIYIKGLGVEKGAFRRIGSSDRRLTEHDMDLLYYLRSGIPYESEVLPDVSWEDIDPAAIAAYRRRRMEVGPGAAELELNDEELLRALNCLVRRNRVNYPNVAGLLLFGTKAALRRLLPIDARVDYVMTEGPEWINNPSSRHYSIDYREPLVTLLPRLHTQIMADLPKLFGLETGKLERTETPIIPRNVIREALANCFMHRDYHAGQPTLVIRYSNRLEFKNAGYSLKPFEELGQSGSRQRNLIIATVFHELHFAETKGTGIESMKRWMQEAGLTTPPIIETDRDRNEFDLVLLPHHLLDQKDLEWLFQFKKYKLSDPERRALVMTREMGAITNQDYRQINGTDTLAASKALAHLRDLGLLSMKGAGNGTYYMLADQLFSSLSGGVVSHTSSLSGGVVSHTSSLSGGVVSHTSSLSGGVVPHTSSLSGGVVPHTSSLSGGVVPHTSSLSGGVVPHTSSLSGGVVPHTSSLRLKAIPKEFPSLSDQLKQRICSLGQRSRKSEIKELIKKLCGFGPLQLGQLARILDRDPKYLRDYYLTKMVRDGELVYQYPDQPAHAQQAYMTPAVDKTKS